MSLPLVFYCLPPAEGHYAPALQICKHLVSRGFDVTVPSDTKWAPAVTSIGAHATPLLGVWRGLHNPEKMGRAGDVPLLDTSVPKSLSCGYAKMIPSGLDTMRVGLTSIHQRLGALHDRSLVIISDTTWSATVALVLGADLPAGFEHLTKPVRYVGVSLMALCWAAPERPPWGSGFPCGANDAAQMLNRQVYGAMYSEGVELLARWMLDAVDTDRPLDELYARHDKADRVVPHPFQDAATACHDVVLQVGLPTFDVRAANDPAHVKYLGFFPAKPSPPDLALPAWYGEVVANSASKAGSTTNRKRIILVAQGTEILDHSETVVPTLRGLAKRPDTLVIAILCQRGATLGPHLVQFDNPDHRLPANARVVDYFPYDAVLAHADAFVSNSGFGGVGHAIANAVPMVQCGSAFDKADIGQRVAHSGLGVFLPDAARTPEAIASAVEEVLGQEKYKLRAAELSAESKTYNPFKIVEEAVLGEVAI